MTPGERMEAAREAMNEGRPADDLLTIEIAHDALQVVILTDHIRRYLLDNDPNALAQVEDSVEIVQRRLVEEIDE